LAISRFRTRAHHRAILYRDSAVGPYILISLNLSNECGSRVVAESFYNWFTQSFDTADLKDAKALIDELSA
jgi:hypothetical protein